MEESLLGGGGGGGESSGSSTSRRQTPHVRFRRRSDAIAYGSAYQRAAALVDLVSILLPHLRGWKCCSLPLSFESAM